MAKVYPIIVLIIVVVVGSATADVDTFFVEGRVYCDMCRVQFETRVSQPLHGAKVNLQCRNRTTAPGQPPTISLEGYTDKNGIYVISVDGDHEDEICEVYLISSPREDCKDPMKSRKKGARVALTQNVGIMATRRYASSLGFMVKEPLPSCDDVLTELGFLPLGQNNSNTKDDSHSHSHSHSPSPSHSHSHSSSHSKSHSPSHSHSHDS